MNQPDYQLHTRLMARHSRLKQIRREFEPLWQVESEIFMPQRSDMQAAISDWSSVGSKIWDGTPQHALAIWTNGIQGYMVSSAIRWFMLTLTDQKLMEFDAVKVWLQDVEQLVYAALGGGNSNFYTALGEYLPDGGCTGTASMFFEEELGTGRIYFVVEHPKNIWLSQNRFGQIDEVHRKYSLAAFEAVKEFGEDNVSLQCKLDAKNSPYNSYDFLHIIQPNDQRIPGKLDYRGKAYLSFHVQVGESKICRKAGMNTIRGAFWRCDRRNGYAYGVSPAERALYDAKVLQVMGKTLMTAGQMAADPPLNVPFGSRDLINWKPRGYNYFKTADMKVSPAMTGVNYPIGADREEKMRESVNRWFNTQFFLAMQAQSRDKTAAEIYAMQSEQAALLGPQIERLSEDSLDEVIRGVYDILGRAGKLPEPPAELIDAMGEPVRVDYVGPIAQARKSLYQMRTIRQTMQDIGQLAAVNPSVADVIDTDELARIMADASQFPQRAVRGKDVVEQIRADRQKAEQMRQQMELAAAAADTAGKLGKPTDKTSPLAALTGLGQN